MHPVWGMHVQLSSLSTCTMCMWLIIPLHLFGSFVRDADKLKRVQAAGRNHKYAMRNVAHCVS